MDVRVIDETGNHYGRWTVLEWADKNKAGIARWLCQCDCGTKGIVRGDSLRDGSSTSCGCSWVLPEGVGACNALFYEMKYGAKKRKREWQLSKEQFRSLTKQPCHYCGREPEQVAGATSRSNGVYIYNGLDRVDNDKGYAPGNVVPCCKHCNRAKRKMTIEQFAFWVTAVYEHLVVGEG